MMIILIHHNIMKYFSIKDQIYFHYNFDSYFKEPSLQKTIEFAKLKIFLLMVKLNPLI